MVRLFICLAKWIEGKMTNLWFFVVLWFLFIAFVIYLSYYQHIKGQRDFHYDDENVPYKLEPRYGDEDGNP